MNPTWQSDLGDGTYRNPILFADYSDPDVIRVGADYYLTASDLQFMPGLPILHSRDLVNWRIIGHVFRRFDFDPRYSLIGGDRYGAGCWAPSLRHHAGRFWIYFCTPDDGLFVSTARDAAGPWEPLTQVVKIAGWEDPCPFWDDDGQAYLVRSRVGAGPLILHRMSDDGKRLLDDGITIATDDILEGPKFYKRGAMYYIFAPTGGVENGVQTVLRSRKLYGPYESKIVLTQGSTPINGPHQGGYIQTPSGEGWFVHFQQYKAWGRIIHLQPVRWENDWPVMGAGGEPILRHAKPDVGQTYPILHPPGADDFRGKELGLQWQWNHNPLQENWSLQDRPGFLRLKAAFSDRGLLGAVNTLTQKLTGPSVRFATQINIEAMADGQVAGLCVLQPHFAALAVAQESGRRRIRLLRLEQPPVEGPEISAAATHLSAQFSDEGAGNVSFSHSADGREFSPIGPKIPLEFSWWKGARPGLFCYTTETDRSKPAGWADFSGVSVSA